MLLSVAALTLDELSFRRHATGRELCRMLGYALVENLGYRQLNEFWGLAGLVDVFRRRRAWGVQHRRGFRTARAPSPPARTIVAPAVRRAPSRVERRRIESLERLVRAHSSRASEREEERRYTLLYLRGYAGLDGRLPPSFDSLVDDVFGDLLERVGRGA
jgi:hypothetical protein